MNNWIVVLICWVVFSIILLLGEVTDSILVFYDWLLILLTAPISIPFLLIAIPIALVVKLIRKIKSNRTLKSLYKSKRRYLK